MDNKLILSLLLVASLFGTFLITEKLDPIESNCNAAGLTESIITQELYP